jgi:hypothetical protein
MSVHIGRDYGRVWRRFNVIWRLHIVPAQDGNQRSGEAPSARTLSCSVLDGRPRNTSASFRLINVRSSAPIRAIDIMFEISQEGQLRHGHFGSLNRSAHPSEVFVPAQRQIQEKDERRNNHFGDEKWRMLSTSCRLGTLGACRLLRVYQQQGKQGLRAWHFFEQDPKCRKCCWK